MRFLILHGTSSSSRGNWFPWLKTELEKRGHKVWVPDLPDADMPNIEKYWDYITNHEWDFKNSIVLGHSSGAVALLGILQKLPTSQKLHAAILAGAFTKRLAESPSWSMLQELFEKPFNFDAIKNKSAKFVFIHSNDDPICDINEAKYLHRQIGGDFVELSGKGHMIKRLDPNMDKFPEILEIIQQKAV